MTTYIRVRTLEDDLRPPRKARFKIPLAVALRHELESDDAPRVVAKGEGTVAEQILQIAFATGVKVREDADLVEILAALDIDSEIPLEAFAAVAEILSYIYYVNGKLPAPDDSPPPANDSTAPPGGTPGLPL